MSIGRDPREWIMEGLGTLLSIGGMYYGWTLGDLIVFAISGSLGIMTFALFRVRRHYGHSVTGGAESLD